MDLSRLACTSGLLVEWCLVLGACLCMGTIGLFSEREFRLIISLRNLYNLDSIVVVESTTALQSIFGELKRMSEWHIAMTYLSSQQLQEILEDGRHRFWHGKTMLVSRGKIHFESYLSLVENQNLMIWVLFKESEELSVCYVTTHDREILRVERGMDSLTMYELLGPGMTGRKVAVSYPEGKCRPRELNLRNVTLKIGISKKAQKRESGIFLQMIFCYHAHIFDLLAEKLSFRKEMIDYEGITHSYVYPNGSYSGFFKMILDGRVNLSVASFVVTKKRLDDFKFIWPTFVMQTMMYLKKGDEINALHSGTPFTTSVWMVTLACTLALGWCLYVVGYSVPDGTSKNPSRGYFHSVLEIVQLTCNQGISGGSSSFSTRILWLTALFGGMLLYYYYSAMVLSYLTLENVKLPFTSIEELVRNGRYKITAVMDGFPVYFMKFEMNHSAQKQLIRQESLPADVQLGLKQLCKGKFLTLLELRGTLMNVKTPDCEVLEVPSPVFDEYFGLAASKEFPFIEEFTLILRRMKEVGIIKRMEGNLTKPGNGKALQLGDGYNAVSAEHLILLFLILNVGAAASLIIFLLEIVNHSRRRDLHEKLIHPHMRHDCTISLQDETFPFQSVTNFCRGNKQVPRRKSMVLFLD